MFGKVGSITQYVVSLLVDQMVCSLNLALVHSAPFNELWNFDFSIHIHFTMDHVERVIVAAYGASELTGEP